MLKLLETGILHDDLQYDILHDDVDDLDVFRVGGARRVSKYAPVILLVHVLKLLGEKLDRRVVVVLGAVVLWEVLLDWAVRQLLLQHVLLVQEQDHAGLLRGVRNLLQRTNAMETIVQTLNHWYSMRSLNSPKLSIILLVF